MMTANETMASFLRAGTIGRKQIGNEPNVRYPEIAEPVHHGALTIMPVETSTCPRCGGTKLEPGSLTRFAVHFRPDNLKFLTLKDGVEVQAVACLDSGHVQLNIDGPNLVKLIKRKRVHRATRAESPQMK
jgi:hypothetical protein